MLDLCLQSADHTRRYSVSVQPSGWEVRLEEDREVRMRNFYQDWHRVERAMDGVQREVRHLLDSGWRLVTS